MTDPRDNYPPGVSGNEPEIAGPDFDKCRYCHRNKFNDCECDRCDSCGELDQDCECDPSDDH